MLVDGSSLGGSQLRLVLSLVFNLLDLLSLLGRGGNFHTQNNVTNFGLGQWRDIDVVLFTIVGYEKIWYQTEK